MALQLPLNFSKDIQGNNINIFPVVIFGDMSKTYEDGSYRDVVGISTREVTIDGIECFPMLLNIPNITESIDLENRKYKISSVTIDVIPYLSKFKRFSNLFDLRSLSNMECRIFWCSQSTNSIVATDLDSSYNDSSLFQVYYGWVRDSRETVNKIQINLEDRSQSKLHLDLPTNHIEDNENIPDSYKNNIIPYVIGHVDRSPCVFTWQQETEFFGLAAKTLLFDSYGATLSPGGGITSFPKYDFPDDGLFALDGEKSYLPLKKDSILEGSQDINFNSMPNKVEFNLSGSSDLANTGGIASYLFREISSWSFAYSIPNHPLEDAAPEGLAPGAFLYICNDLSTDTVGTNAIDTYIAPRLNVSIDGSNTTDFQENTSLRLKGMVSDENETWAYIRFNLKPYDSDWSCSTYAILKVRKHSENHTAPWLIKPGANEDYQYNIDMGHVTPDADNFSESSNANLKDYMIGGEGDWTTVSQHSSFQIGVPNPQDESSMDWSNDENHFDLYVDEAHVFQEVHINNLLSQKIYADVMSLTTVRAEEGGEIVSPEENRFSNVIGKIISDELNVSMDELYDNDSPGLWINPNNENYYNTWRYDFTIDKRINSKRLFEEISSASPSILRMKYNDKFDIVTIPPSEPDVVDISINSQDVINFQFSRTPIQNVYTKIIFKYNWDYGLENFLSSVSYGIYDLYPTIQGGEAGGYDYSYYGFKTYNEDILSEENVSDTTLLIDDHRGKYIRNKETAESFAKWLLMFHCNQHLKIKITLPLKYINIEIADIVIFDKLISDIKPYGINYAECVNQTCGDLLNGQFIYNKFIVTKTKRTINFVEVELTQLHSLEEEAIAGCTDTDACNYNPNATIDVGCKYEDCEGVCGGDNGSVDCLGACNGMAEYDECGVCNGPGYDCEGGCNGIVEDNCGVCGGDGSSCQYCNVFWGTINYDPNDNTDEGCLTPTINNEICPTSQCCNDSSAPNNIPTNYICDEMPERCSESGLPEEYKGVWIVENQFHPLYNTSGWKWSDIHDYYNQGCFDNDCSSYFPTLFSITSCNANNDTANPSILNVDYGTYKRNNFSDPEDDELVFNLDNISNSSFPYPDHSILYPMLDLQTSHYDKFTIKIDTSLYNHDNLKIKIAHSFAVQLNENPDHYIDLTNKHPEELFAEDSTYFAYSTQDEVSLYGMSNSELSNGLIIHNGTSSLEGESLDIGNMTTDHLDYLSEYGEMDKRLRIAHKIDIKLIDAFTNAGVGEDNEIMDSFSFFLYTDSGFPPEPEEQGCQGNIGDLNNDGGYNVLDIVTLANCVLAGNCMFDIYTACGDMNSDGGYNVLDVVTLANCVLSSNCGGE